MYRSILEAPHFHLCFSYLQKFEAILHEYQNIPQISKREILISNDSVFVEQFNMRYQNEYGGITNGEMTYVYVKTESGLSYALEDYFQNYNKKFIMCMADVFNRAPKGKYSETWDVGDPALIPKVNYPATTPEELEKISLPSYSS